MQLSILSVDIVSCFLISPVFFFPVTVVIYRGFMCFSQTTMGIAALLLVQCSVQVAITVTFTLHFKYCTIAVMTSQRRVTRIEKGAVRLIFWFILELPVGAAFLMRESMQDVLAFLKEEHQFSLASLLEQDVSLDGIAFSTHSNLVMPYFIISGVAMSITVTVCGIFIHLSLFMLKRKTSTMSEKTRKMQQNLTYTIIMQLQIPLTVQIVPMAILGYSLVASSLTPVATNVVYCVLKCHAIVHTVFLILTTPSYRSVFTRCCNNKRRATNASAVLNGSTRYVHGDK